MPTNSITSVFKADTSGFDKSLKQTRSLVEATFSDYKSTLTKANSAQEKLTRTTREHAAALKPLTAEAEKLYQKQADGVKLSKKEATRLKDLRQQVRAMTNAQKLRERELRKEATALNQLAAAQKRYGTGLKTVAIAEGTRQTTKNTAAIERRTPSSRHNAGTTYPSSRIACGSLLRGHPCLSIIFRSRYSTQP
jgi:hypothetical protein